MLLHLPAPSAMSTSKCKLTCCLQQLPKRELHWSLFRVMLAMERLHWRRCNAELVQRDTWHRICAKCMLDKCGAVLVKPSSTPGREGLGKTFWAQILADSRIGSSTGRRGGASVSHYRVEFNRVILMQRW